MNAIGELVSPQAGGVTDCGKVMTMPLGALPTQATEKVTGELNPPREFTTRLVPTLDPGLADTVSVTELIEKSEVTTAGTGFTGARTGGVLAIMTEIWVE